MPLAEHDAAIEECRRSLGVSIHVPLAEHDAYRFMRFSIKGTFQFTCPSRSTTII